MTAWGLNLVNNGNGNGDGKNKIEICSDCNRTFASGRLEAHAKVCKRLFKDRTNNSNNNSNNNSDVSTTKTLVFPCPNCESCTLGSRNQLLSHLRSCLLNENAPLLKNESFNKSNTSKSYQSACPFCARPCEKNALSSHLLRCRQHKEVLRKRNLGDLPGVGKVGAPPRRTGKGQGQANLSSTAVF